MIYGRFGTQVTILRLATLEDVEKLDGRKPDKQDREAVANTSYVVVVDEGDEKKRERLYHQAFLRADRGSVEISEALERIADAREGRS